MIRPITANNVNFGKIYHVMDIWKTSEAEKQIGMKIENELKSPAFSDKKGLTLEQQLEKAGFDAVLFYDNANKIIKLTAASNVQIDDKTGKFSTDDTDLIDSIDINDNKKQIDLYNDLVKKVDNFISHNKINDIVGKALQTFMAGIILLAVSLITITALKKCNPEKIEKTIPNISATIGDVAKIK